jgi:hypothetical protein
MLAANLESLVVVDLQAPGTLRDRLRLLWNVGVAARGDLADDELKLLLLRIAHRSHLTSDLARFHKREPTARKDVEHVATWALLGRDPFGD